MKKYFLWNSAVPGKIAMPDFARILIHFILMKERDHLILFNWIICMHMFCKDGSMKTLHNASLGSLVFDVIPQISYTLCSCSKKLGEFFMKEHSWNKCFLHINLENCRPTTSKTCTEQLTQLKFTCSKSPLETLLKRVWNMFKVNDKNTTTTPHFEQISHISHVILFGWKLTDSCKNVITKHHN